MSSRPYELVVFGASGFTGQFVVEFVAKAWKKGAFSTWAVAGRNEAKLRTVLENATK